MWAGPHTDLLSGKSISIDMHETDSASMTLIQLTNQHSALLYSGMNIHVVELSQHVKIQHKDNIICGALCQNVAGL